MTPNRFPTPSVEYRPNKHTLEKLVELKSYYWASVLLHTMDGIPELKIGPLRGVTLAGSPGNGRHITAEALSGTLSQQGYGYFVRITGATLDTEDVADACTVITGAVTRMRQYDRFCMLVDCPEDSRHNLAIQECLRRLMEDYHGKLFLILITASVSNISPVLQSMTQVCQFQRPNLNERRSWLMTYLEGKIPIHIEGKVNYITLTKETEGFTWRQMTDLRTLLRRSMAMKYSQNKALYAAMGTRKTLFENGEIHLTKDEVYAALACVRGQGASEGSAAAGPVQYVAAMPAGAPSPAISMATVPAPAAKAAPQAQAVPEKKQLMTEDEKDAQRQEQEFHSHPEKMTYGELINIDNL